MRSIVFVASLIVLTCCPLPSAFAGDQGTGAAPAVQAAREIDEDVGTPLVGIAAVVIVAAIVVVALVVCVLLCATVVAIVCGAVALGVISNALLIGLLSRRKSLAFRAFMAQLCVLFAVGSVVGVGLIVRHLGHLAISLPVVIAGGVGFGIVLGVILAALVDALLGFAYEKVAHRVRTARAVTA